LFQFVIDKQRLRRGDQDCKDSIHEWIHKLIHNVHVQVNGVDQTQGRIYL